MFKNKTEKEVFYIFVWLIGIILFYTLIFFWILEPSKEKQKETKPTHQEKKEVIHKNIQKNKPIKRESSVKKLDIHTESFKQKETILKHISTPEKTIKVFEPKTITTPSIPKAIEVPRSNLSTPSIPSVPTIPSIKKESLKHKYTSRKDSQETHTKKIDKKVYTQEKNSAGIEKERLNVMKEAEDIRDTAIKLLQK